MADLDPNFVDPVAARFGPAGAAEWAVLLNQLDVGSGFALDVLSFPDPAGAAVCRDSLRDVLQARALALAVIEPATPDRLRQLPADLFALPAMPDLGAVWVSAVPGAVATDRPAWEAGWRHALGSLN